MRATWEERVGEGFTGTSDQCSITGYQSSVSTHCWARVSGPPPSLIARSPLRTILEDSRLDTRWPECRYSTLPGKENKTPGLAAGCPYDLNLGAYLVGVQLTDVSVVVHT